MRRQVACEIGASHSVAEAREYRVGVGGDHDIAAVERRIRVRRRDIAQNATGTGAGHARDLVVGDRRLHERHDRLVDRDINFLAAAAAGSFVERGQRTDDCEETREGVADRHSRARRRPVGIAGGVPDPAHRLTDRAETGFGRARTGLAETRHMHEHDARVVAGECCVVESPARQGAGLEVLEHDVAPGGDAARDVAAARVA